MMVIIVFLIMIVLMVLPVYILGKYVYNSDINKESKKILKKIMVFGMVLAIIAGICSNVILRIFPDTSSIWDKIFHYFIAIALIEEFSKFLPGYFIGVKSSEFDEVYDAIVYMVFSALGFALIENIFYVSQGSLFTAISRFIFTVPMHVSCGIIMGYFIGIAYKKMNNGNKFYYFLNMFFSILVPTLYHGLFDFGLNYSYTLEVIVLILDIFIIIWSIFKVKAVSKEPEKINIK